MSQLADKKAEGRLCEYGTVEYPGKEGQSLIASSKTMLCPWISGEFEAVIFINL